MRSPFAWWPEMEGALRSAFRGSVGGAAPRLAGWVPAVDIYATEGELVLLMDVPGVKMKDVEVVLAGDVLTIRGQKMISGATAGRRYSRIECGYGPFERSFAIGWPVDGDSVKASLKNGVLRVTVPRTGKGTAGPR